jgi:hypothetical protein
MYAWRILTALTVLAWLTGCGDAPKPEPAAGRPMSIVAAPAEPATEAEPVVEAAPVVETEAAPAEPPAPPRDLTRIAVDVKQKTITVEGRFCLEKGILDYLAVVSGGREYESLVALDVKPSRLHAGLLAIGAEPGPTEEMLEEMKKDPPKDRKLPDRAGTSLRVTIEWTNADGKAESMSASRLLTNRATKEDAEAAPWVFTGSFFSKHPETGEQFYAADADEVLFAVFSTDAAVANFTKDRGNPYDGMDTGYEANTKLVPKKGAPCKVVISLWDTPPEPGK